MSFCAVAYNVGAGWYFLAATALLVASLLRQEHFGALLAVGLLETCPPVGQFVVDFAGETLAGLAPETPVEAVVLTTSGHLSKPVVQANPETHGWRLFFELNPDGNTPADLRAFLRHGDDVLSETWSFRWVHE